MVPCSRPVVSKALRRAPAATEKKHNEQQQSAHFFFSISNLNIMNKGQVNKRLPRSQTVRERRNKFCTETYSYFTSTAVVHQNLFLNVALKKEGKQAAENRRGPLCERFEFLIRMAISNK